MYIYIFFFQNELRHGLPFFAFGLPLNAPGTLQVHYILYMILDAICSSSVSSSHRPRRQFWLSCTNLVFYFRRLRVELYSDECHGSIPWYLFPERLFQERFALSGAILDHFFRAETRRGRLERPPPPGRLPTQAFIACVRQVRMARHEFLVCHPIWLFVRC